MCCICVWLQCVLCEGIFPVCPVIKGEFRFACLPFFDLFSFFPVSFLVLLTIVKKPNLSEVDTHSALLRG